MIRGAIFDADGTLLDSMKIWEEAGSRYLETLGIKPEPNLSEILFSMSLEEGCLYLKTHCRVAETIEEIKAGVLHIIADFFRNEVQAKKGAAAFLHKLQQYNVPMVIATSGDALLLDAALKRLKIRSYFRRIVTCSELAANKREPYIYQTAARYLKVDCVEIADSVGIVDNVDIIDIADINQIFVFEDVLYALQTASLAGFKTVAVEDVASANEKKQIVMAADYYMSDFSDFDRFWRFAADGLS